MYGYGYGYGGGLLYWVILGVTMLLSLGAMGYLKSVYARAAQVPVASGLTGAQTAARILQWAGINDVQIVEGESFLGDHYDPLNKRLVLSRRRTYEGSSAAQCRRGGPRMRPRAAAPAALCSRCKSAHGLGLRHELCASNAIFCRHDSPPLLFPPSSVLTCRACGFIALCSFGVIMLFNLITLPVEFDASARAKVVLQRLGIVRPGARGAGGQRSTLNAAGLTYVAAFIGTLPPVSLLRDAA
jgi:Zn-dependent membrane protease YugP